MMLTVGVKSIYYNALLSGEKTHEGRKADGCFASLKNGDQVLLHNEDTDESTICVVVDKQVFPSLEAGVRAIGWCNLMPHQTSEEATIAPIKNG